MEYIKATENTEKVEYAKAADIAALTELRFAYLEEDHGKLSEEGFAIIRRDLPAYHLMKFVVR